MTNFTIDCAYCDPTTALLTVELPAGADELSWRNAWKNTLTAGPGGTTQYRTLLCSGCGGEFQLEDDGVLAAQGGIVKRKNISRPRVDSISVVNGTPEGGTSLTLTGLALDQGALTVKFGDIVASSVTNITSTTATVTTPPGCYRLLPTEYLYKLTLSGISGTYTLDEGFTIGATGVTGTIRDISGADYLVYLTGMTADPATVIVGETLTGGTSAATGNVDSVASMQLITGEQLVGEISGESGTLRASPHSIIVDAPAGAFAPNEVVIGQTSGHGIKLGAAPYSGDVDVTVENELGQRIVGGSLVDGFTYL